MTFISEATVTSETSLVGGKGHHLQKLRSWAAPVPEFFVLTTETFQYYHQTRSIPEAVVRRFDDFFKKHAVIALRSSMTSEDAADASFAGMFETLLDVTRENWQASLLHIYNSVRSDRVREYITKKNIQVDLQMAVVAQELVRVEKSGVLFTRSPVSPTAAVAIDAAFGMGEGVVSGHTDVDHYQLTRTGEVIAHHSKNEKAVLTDKELRSLLSLALNLERQNKSPSDIEWGILNDRIYVFQIRPITRSFEPLTFFVDTNLSESYPGTVSPFTAGFVKKAYENVFKESAMTMGAKGKRLETLSYHYARLISSVDDHLYYNLEHYYAVLRALPGGEKNIDNWHRMIGGKMEGIQIPYHATELSASETFMTLFHLLKIGFGRRTTFGPFLAELEKLKGEIEKKTISLRHSREIIFYLHDLINRPIGFGLTVVNDIFIMMGLGILTRSLRKMGVSEDAVIDLLKTHEEVESVKPLEHFNQLVQSLSEDFLEALARADLSIGFSPYEEILSKLKSEGFEAETNDLAEFLRLYGDRSFEELKLESLPLKNNPVLLKDLVLWSRKNQTIATQSTTKMMPLQLGWFDRKVAAFTRDSIATREATRLWRGKFYHLLRQLVLSLGKKLQEEDGSWKEFSLLDFFSLSHHEWYALGLGDLSRDDAQRLIRERRIWQTKKMQYPEIIPWVESEKLPTFQSIVSSAALVGHGVSPGIVEGYALVLENPQDALASEERDFILVTKNTDPAWVYIMSRSLGLISEKGSLLSHTAIIGRELNIPTIVGVKLATQKLVTGQRIRIDAGKGTIEVL